MKIPFLLMRSFRKLASIFRRLLFNRPQERERSCPARVLLKQLPRRNCRFACFIWDFCRFIAPLYLDTCRLLPALLVLDESDASCRSSRMQVLDLA